MTMCSLFNTAATVRAYFILFRSVFFFPQHTKKRYSFRRIRKNTCSFVICLHTNSISIVTQSFGVTIDIVTKLGLNNLPFIYETLVQFSMIKGLAYIYPNLGGFLGICFEVGVWGVARV